MKRRVAWRFLLVLLVSHLWVDAAENKFAGRIIGGRQAESTKYNFVVSIQVNFFSVWSHTCGGNIISAKAVMTACHCVVEANKWDPPKLLQAENVRIVAGVKDLNSDSEDKQIREVKKVEAHPKCGNRPYYLFYDVGAFVLKEPLEFTTSVQPMKVISNRPVVALKYLSLLAKKGALCHSPGWGATKSAGNNPSTIMKVAKLRLFTTKQCQKFFCENNGSYCQLDYFDAKQICAAGTDAANCSGDSGGPLICNGYVFGLVSWRIKCAFNWPHIFSNIVPILEMYNKHSNETLSAGSSFRDSLKPTKY